MQGKKELKLDVYDREILKYLIAHKDRWITTNQIAKKTGFNWITVDRHIEKMKESNLVEVAESGKKRKYKENKKGN